MGAAVIDVSHDVHMIDGKAFDERRQAANEVPGASRLDDRLDNAPVIGGTIGLLAGARVEELVDDVGVRHRHRLTHL